MSESKGRQFQYEAMFLISQSVAADLGAAVEHIKSIIARSHASLVAMRKWDERRLAYEIDKQKRGTYILVFFTCDPVNVAHIERDANLSEQIMRMLILRADHLSLEEMQAADGQRELETEAALRKAKAEAQQQPQPPAAQETPETSESPEAESEEEAAETPAY